MSEEGKFRKRHGSLWPKYSKVLTSIGGGKRVPTKSVFHQVLSNKSLCISVKLVHTKRISHAPITAPALPINVILSTEEIKK